MILPFESLSEYQRELGLVAGVGIGFGFGFVLERAGFGNANKLAAQFYLYDMTVLKVMFTAIVTAMLGTVGASSLGLLDLRALADSAASNTFLLPMVAGGFLFGVGFVVSGLCPGTSVVAAASGSVDGMVTYGAIVAGTFLYSELDPVVSRFQGMTDLGHLYLQDLVGVSPLVMAVMVTALALSFFLGGEWLERFFSARLVPEARPGDERWARRPRRLAFGALAAMLAVGVAGLALPKGTSAQGAREVVAVGQADLARRVLEAPWKTRVLDLRERDACVAARVPGAECVPSAEISKLGLGWADATRDLVLVGERGLATLPPEAAAYPGRVFVLEGGFEGWRAFALTAPEAPGESAGSAEREAWRQRAAVHGALTGTRQAPPPPPPSGVAAPRPKKGGGCSG